MEQFLQARFNKLQEVFETKLNPKILIQEAALVGVPLD